MFTRSKRAFGRYAGRAWVLWGCWVNFCHDHQRTRLYPRHFHCFDGQGAAAQQRNCWLRRRQLGFDLRAFGRKETPAHATQRQAILGQRAQLGDGARNRHIVALAVGGLLAHIFGARHQHADLREAKFAGNMLKKGRLFGDALDQGEA